MANDDAAVALARKAQHRRLWTIIFSIIAGAAISVLLAVIFNYHDPVFAGALGAMIGLLGTPWAITITAPRRGRIILLRKFDLERPPVFPICKIVSKLRLDGYEVITLADTEIESDEDTLRSLSLALCIPIAVPVLTLILIGPAYLVASFTDSEFLLMIALAPLLVAVIAVIGTLGTILERLPILFAELLMTVLRPTGLGRIDVTKISPENVPTALARKLKRHWVAGTKVVAASDKNWRDVVQFLVKDASLTLIDVSKPTRHLLTEISMIASHTNGRKVIWLYPESDTLGQLSPSATGYSAFGFHFEGPMRSFRYPKTADQGFYRKVGRVAGDALFWGHVDRLRIEALRSYPSASALAR